MGQKVIDPKSGEVRDLPGAEAEAEFRAGRVHLLPGQDVPLADQNGQLAGYFAPEKVSEAIRDGVLRFADSKEVARHEAEQQPVQAFAEGFANNLTLPGAFDLPAKLAGADMDMVNARRETGMGKLGSVGGFLTGLAIPGEGQTAHLLGGASKLLPNVLMETATKATANAAEKAIAGLIEREATRKAIAQGLGHAVTGAGIGALATLDEAALGNIDASTETILTGMGAGGLLGGTLGTGLGFLAARRGVDGRIVAGGAKAAREAEVAGELSAAELTAALEAQGQEVDAAGMQHWFPRLMAKVSSKATGVAEEDVTRVMSPAGQRAILAGERARDGAAKSMADLIDSVEAQHAKFNLEESRVANSVLNEIPQGAGDSAIRNGAQAINVARDALDSMVKNAANYGMTETQMAARLRPLHERLKKAEDRIFGEIQDADTIIARRKESLKAAASEAMKAAQATEKQLNRSGAARIGSGANRVVYEGGDGTAIKVAKHAQGINQNISEVQLAGRSPVINEVIDHAPDYSWVKQKQVETFDALSRAADEDVDAAMAKFLDIPASDGWLSKVVKSEYTGPRSAKLDAFEARLEQLRRDVPELDPYDLQNPSQWGIGKDGEVVLVDFGYRLKEDPEALLRGKLGTVADSAVPVSHRAAKEVYRELDQVYRVLSAQDKKIKPLIGEAPGLGEVAESLKHSLQDESIWGGAARAHAELTTAAERAERSAELLREHFPLKGGKVDRAKVLQFTKDLDRLTGEPRIEALTSWIDAQRALAKAASANMENVTNFTPQLEKLTKQYGDVYQAMRRDVLSLNAQDRLLSSNRAQGIIPGLALGAGLSAMGLGHAGFLAGNAAGNAILNPGRAARTVAAMAAFRKQVAQHIEGRVERLVGAGKRPINRLPTDVPKWLGAMMEGTPKERADAYREHIEQMQAVSRPDVYVAHVAPQLAPIAEAMPNHTQAITQRGQEIMAYLSKELPAPVAPAPTTNDWVKLIGKSQAEAAKKFPTPDSSAIRNYGQVVDVAVRGAPAVLDRMEKGNIRASHVRAFRTLYPNQDADLRRQLMETLPNAGKMPKQVRQAISVYLSDAQPTDPALRQVRQQIYQGEAEGAAQAASPTNGTGGTTINVIGPLSTPNDQLQNFPFSPR